MYLQLLVVAKHPSVAECAVFGVTDEFRGEIPVAMIVLKDGNTTNEEQISEEIIKLVRDTIGAVAYFRVGLFTSLN
ncbi:hypothetical protein M1146_06075 [Patescibacteria group bacterium]|nr:hypothetical protein [Patescibacteria group bacterium]